MEWTIGNVDLETLVIICSVIVFFFMWRNETKQRDERRREEYAAITETQRLIQESVNEILKAQVHLTTLLKAHIDEERQRHK